MIPDPYALHSWLLHFLDPRTELAYREAFYLTRRPALLAALIIAIVVMSLFGVLDPAIAGPELGPILLLRYGVALPVLLGLVPFLALERLAPLGKRWLPELVAGFLSAAMGALSVVCVKYIALSSVEAAIGGIGGFAVGMTSVYGTARLRFPHAVALGLATALTGLAAPLYDPNIAGTRYALMTAIVLGTTAVGLFTAYSIELYDRRDYAHRAQIAQEQERSERLLRAMLPPAIAEELKAGARTIARRHGNVAVLFADIVGFTPLCERLTANDLVGFLERVFGRFDAVVAAHGVEKIKTVGDAYMIAAGATGSDERPAARLADVALVMLEETRALAAETGLDIAVRIGLATGPAVAGVIGEQKPAFDLWGDTVNAAARMESHGEPGRIQITSATAATLAPEYSCELRGLVPIKGKGTLETWWLVARRRDL